MNRTYFFIFNIQAAYSYGMISGKQIRNVAAVGGNIMTGSPISDLNPIFMAANCTLRIASISEDKQVSFDDKFYTVD